MTYNFKLNDTKAVNNIKLIKAYIHFCTHVNCFGAIFVGMGHMSTFADIVVCDYDKNVVLTDVPHLFI